MNKSLEQVIMSWPRESLVVATRKLSRANEVNNQSNNTIYMHFPNKDAPISPASKSAIYTSYWWVKDLAPLWPWFLTKLPKNY
jgi:hypothetical protein